MKTEQAVPETLLEAVKHFADPDAALACMVSLRWPEGVICPHCASVEVTFLEKRRVWQCKAKECRRQFSAKVGTIFEDSPIGLDKWLPVVWMIVNCKNGISSYEVARNLGVTQKTAWFMLHRIRLAMQAESFGKMGGDVEVDETLIGGKARFMHKDRHKALKGRGTAGKVAVMGLLERHGRDDHSTVRVEVVPGTKRGQLQGRVRRHVEAGSNVYTDALRSYIGLDSEYFHGVIDHSEKYVDGLIHTNGLENFWSLLKRAIKGTYVSIEPFHLFRYLDEQTFRFNNRKATDAVRFVAALRSVVGRRVTYKSLIGAGLPEPETC